jgi:hypothetical protein
VGFLLVDDADGQVLAELETIEEALEILERLAQDPGTANLCLVEFGGGGGALTSFQSTTTLRVLQ